MIRSGVRVQVRRTCVYGENTRGSLQYIAGWRAIAVLMSHLNLLQDLLSLTELPDELYTTLAQQIALLPLPALQQLLNISLCSSPALDSARLNLSTAVKFYTATRRGLQTRILRLLSEQHSHWTNRRRLSALYEALHDTVAEAPASNDILKPILSASLKSSIAIKDAPFISDGLRDKCDQWMIESWKNYLGVVQVEHRKYGSVSFRAL